MVDNELMKALRSLCLTYGLFAVLVMLREIGKESCKEFIEAGNYDAVIHMDTMSLANCIESMKLNHPLYGYREASIQVTLEEMGNKNES